MNVLDLFSGIGGFSLGLERAGMRTVAFCEIEPYCRAVLRKRWPSVPIFEDVRLLHAADVSRVDVICGGFPCQDISLAGKGAGLSGERSGLWFEYERIIKEIRPRYVIIENVSALRSRGLDVVLWSLTALGYDAEWHCIPACAVGAPHRRDRVWIVAHANGTRLQRVSGCGGASAERQPGGHTSECRENVADTIRERQPGSGQSWDARNPASIIQREAIDAFHGCFGNQWITEPDVGRVANGVPSRMDRLKSLGNAVVPQIPELIGRAIMQAEGLAA